MIPGNQVLAHADADLRHELFVGILQPLALADRIVDQHDISHAYQALGKRLIGLVCLPVARMATRADHARQRKLSALGDVEIGRHRKVWPTLEDDLFDSVRITLDDTGYPRIERRFLRHWAETFANLLSNRADVRFRIGLGLQFGLDRKVRR